MKKMKNAEIIALVNRGLLNLDYSNIAAAQSYKIFKTLRAFKDAAKAYDEQRAELVRRHVPDEELGKAQAYEQAKDRTAEGLMSAEDYAKVLEKLRTAQDEVNELLGDEVELDARPVPFEVYFALKKDNRELLRPDADMMLEGIMWKEEEGAE